MILALIALVMIPAQDPPALTAAGVEAFKALGAAARREATDKPDRLFVMGQCGDSWNSIMVRWAEPGAREAVRADAKNEDDTLLMFDLVQVLCDSFAIELAENQAFDFLWSERGGVANFEIGRVTSDYGGNFFARSEAREKAFFAAD